MDSTLTAYHPMPRQSCVAREGYPFVAIACAAALLLWFVGLSIGALLMLGGVAFVVFFFRNPERRTPDAAGLVVAPADGRVLSVARGVKAPCTEQEATRISIFMSVFNVHINRFPISAKVKRAAYHAGRFFVASLDKASEMNERNALVLEDERGREVVMVQIAGLIARRIVCYVREGDARARGERFGLIRFGSRVDLYLPPEAAIAISAGERVRAGETILGRLP